MTDPVYIDPLVRLKQERELKKAKKKVRKEVALKVGDKMARKLVKHAANKVMSDASFEQRIMKKSAARGG
jgi:hypothetical protein